MRKAIVTGAALGIVVLMGTPALAAPPEVSQKNCDDVGGTFVRDHGVKSCTTTTVDTVTSEGPGPRAEMYWGSWGWVDYSGTIRDSETVRTTTTQSQKGNGDVTTASDSVLLSRSVDWLTCHVEATFFGASFTRNVDPDVCAHPQNYPADSLFG
jgi:hypothetical protein